MHATKHCCANKYYRKQIRSTIPRVNIKKDDLPLPPLNKISWHIPHIFLPLTPAYMIALVSETTTEKCVINEASDWRQHHLMGIERPMTGWSVDHGWNVMEIVNVYISQLTCPLWYYCQWDGYRWPSWLWCDAAHWDIKCVLLLGCEHDVYTCWAS